MNTIIGSFSKDKIIEIAELNPPGAVAHSVSCYDIENRGLFSINRGRGKLKYKMLDSDPSFYKILFLQYGEDKHIQPTTDYDIYPSESPRDNFYEHALWFKGELKPKEIEKLQFEEDTKDDWGPDLLLKHVVRYEAPVDVDGSFACVYCDGKDLFIFRNEFESMFIDQDMNISTVAFSGSTTTSANKMFKLDFKKKGLKQVDEFATVRHWI